MEEKDNIREIVQDKFRTFEAEVNPEVWKKIQLQLKTSAHGHGGSGAGMVSKVYLWVSVTTLTIILSVGFIMTNTSDEMQVSVSPLESTVNSSKSDDLVDEDNIKPLFIGIKNEKDNKSEITRKDSIIDNERSTDARRDNVGRRRTEKNRQEVDKHEDKSGEQNPKQVLEAIVTTPNHIDISSQSSVIAVPVGGKAPLLVQFSTLSAKLKRIKWDFDDGTKSEEVSPSHIYNVPGIYFVSMIAELENGDIVMDKAVVEVKSKGSEIGREKGLQPSIRVPNVFTPNGDGINDQLVVVSQGITTFSMSVYSVNGKLVYRSSHPDTYWNGTDMNGNEVPEGTYYYLINAIGEDGTVFAPKGYLTIRRGY